MWELLINGVNLLGSAAGIGSFASGFALEKDIGRISNSLRRLEELNHDLLRATQNNRRLIEQVVPVLSEFPNLRTPAQQATSAGFLQQYLSEFCDGITATTRNILTASVAEVQNVVDSIHYAETKRVKVPEQLLHRIAANPSALGIPQVWDISNGGLLGWGGCQIMDNSVTPITWSNPLTGRVFLGEVPYEALRRYGLDIRAPKYQLTRDGYAYSPAHGLYLPVGFGIFAEN